MAQKLNLPDHFAGLSASEVITRRAQFGANIQQVKRKGEFWWQLLSFFSEPMLLLLIAIAIIYFILAQYGEAWFMIFAIAAVSGISFYQDTRSRNALAALEKLTSPTSRVLRDHTDQFIPTQEIVPGDLVIVEEGNTINADGDIVYSHDFSVNESSLTGEVQSIFKSADTEDQKVYSGTIVASGLAVYAVSKTGTDTRIGQLGKAILQLKEEETPLQKQISVFVRRMAIGGVIVFLIVWGFNFWKSHSLLASLLKGLTLAMSVLPEEIPVAFTTFMAIGAWRLMQRGIIIKKTRVVETLGSATVICTDKTGTITENRMDLVGVYAAASNRYFDSHDTFDETALQVIEISMWASEPIPFDSMEKTLHTAYESNITPDRRPDFEMIHEYPLDGSPPMMTHLFENKSGERIIAAKGAPEAILSVCSLTPDQITQAQTQVKQLAEKGYRLLGVAKANDSSDDFPVRQQDFPFQFLGLVAFYDPPKKNIRDVFSQLHKAGLRLKIITGDNLLTTTAIARQAGLPIHLKAMDGEPLMKLTPDQFSNAVRDTVLFTRMFPEAKLAVVNELKAQQEVVAMIGDGVNDGPALKAAHIGIAMGHKGTEMAKQAADMVLSEDDLSNLEEAIAAGRRIYANLKKAIQYIISIHIPILLTVSLPLLLGWLYPDIFTPVHVIFLELVMGPTCSIVYENEPMEKDTMTHPPRKMTSTFLSWREMSFSILQGLVVSAGVLFAYRLIVLMGGHEELVRSMVFTTLILANIFLTLVNRSFFFSFLTTLQYKNKLIPAVILATMMLLGIILYFPPVSHFFHMDALDVNHIIVCLSIAAISVFWFEIVKWRRRRLVIPTQMEGS